jgi:hypothetical protein
MRLFDGNVDMLGSGEVTDLAERILAVYTPELPQSYRFPALMRVFALFLAGQMGRMREMLDEVVEGCRAHGRTSDLAFILMLRAKMRNDMPEGLDGGAADGEESLALFTDAGDQWGMSQALAARGETLANQGMAEEAAAAYREAMKLAEELGAPQEVPMLMVQLGNALMKTDLAEGEQTVRAALELVGPHNQAANGTILFGHLILAGLHAEREEYAEAIAELDLLDSVRHTFGPMVPGVVSAMLACTRGWILARAGDPEQGLELLHGGWRLLREIRGDAGVFAEQMTVMMMPAAAGVLRAFAERDAAAAPARRAATLLGAHAGLNGPGGMHLEQLDRTRAERSLRLLLGDEEYEAAHAEGGGLSLGEAAALLDALNSGSPY